MGRVPAVVSIGDGLGVRRVGPEFQTRCRAVLTEADTCRKYVLPKLYAAGWNDDQISEQKSFTDGRIIVAGATARRGPQKRADYLLRYRPNLMLAVVEAKASYKKSRDGLQQAKDYAQILDLQFAYATDGHGIVEHDFLAGRETDLEAFPSPDELWTRLQAHLGLKRPEDQSASSRRTRPFPARRRGTIRKSPSTGRFRHCSRGGGASS